ncbi:MAG: hypothetical protein KC912_20285 [Proteobacteria bacterium]|nr:hypothetical protein [Pseudomonadota bacterium]
MREFLRWMVLICVWVALPAWGQEPKPEEEAKQNLVQDSLNPKKGKLAARLTPFADGLVRAGGWAPVHVKLANGGDNLRLRLIGHEMGADYQQQSYERRVELPEGARKDAILYVKTGRSGGVRKLDVIGDAERSGSIEYPVRMLGDADVGIAVIGQTHAGITGIQDTWQYGVPSAMPRPHASGKRSVKTGLVPLDALPDRAAGWSAVDWVVWPEADPTAISAESLDALLGWVASGGHLFVTVTDRHQRLQGPLADALPLRFEGVDDVESVSSLFQVMGLRPPAGEGPYPVGRASLSTADRHLEVLAKIDDRPVWALGGYGLGTVHALAMDPTAAPFSRTGDREEQWRSWLWLPETSANPARMMAGTGEGFWDPTRDSTDYTVKFWVSDPHNTPMTERGRVRGASLAAMDVTVTDPTCMYFMRTSHPALVEHWSDNDPASSWETALKARLADIPGVAPLPLSWLMAFAGLYLMVIGPLDYFVLRLLKKQPWTWVTFPVTIVIFSTVALVGTSLTKGSQAVMTRIEVVDALPGTPFTRGTTWFGVFSTRKTEVGVKSDRDGALVLPLGDGGFMSEVSVRSAEASGEMGYLAQTWSLGYGSSSWVGRGDSGHIEVKTLEDGGWAVTSRLEHRLTHARLRVNGRTVAIGDLEPDESVTLRSGGNSLAIENDRTRWAVDHLGDIYEGGHGHLHGDLVIGVLDDEVQGLELSGLWPQPDTISVFRIPVRIEP